MQDGCREKALTKPPSRPPAALLHTHQKIGQINRNPLSLWERAGVRVKYLPLSALYG